MSFYFILGLQFWVNMKPYSDQPFGPSALPYTIGVTGKDNLIDQKISVHKLRPGYHTTIHVVPKILETSADFDNMDINKRECKLPHETSGFNLFNDYSQKKCEIECATKKALSFCHCLPWQYPNNFTSIQICDMFGGFCFNEIISNEVFYKSCKTECLADCQEMSLSVWQRTVPLNIDDLCKHGAFFDRFFKQNFQKIFPFEKYRSFIQDQHIPDLATISINESFCKDYIKNYVSLVSVESPTENVAKSKLDKRVSWIDQLGIIGGNLGLCVGMSVLGMVEATIFIYLVLKSLIQDVNTLRKMVISFLKFKRPIVFDPLDNVKACRSRTDHNLDEHDDIEETTMILKLYVSINTAIIVIFSNYLFIRI